MVAAVVARCGQWWRGVVNGDGAVVMISVGKGN